MPSYNASVVTERIAAALAAQPRGSQTRLAEQLGVRVQTVNKWVKGQTCPEPERWPAIEQALELDPGSLAAESGLATISRPWAKNPEERLEELRRSLVFAEERLRELTAERAKEGEGFDFERQILLDHYEAEVSGTRAAITGIERRMSGAPARPRRPMDPLLSELLTEWPHLDDQEKESLLRVLSTSRARRGSADYAVAAEGAKGQPQKKGRPQNRPSPPPEPDGP